MTKNQRIALAAGIFIAAIIIAMWLAPRPRPRVAMVFQSDGSQASIQALHDSASCHDGDTITVPNGAFVWTGTVKLTKAVILKGNSVVDSDAGTLVAANTIVKDNQSGRTKIIEIQTGDGAGVGPRVTGFDFEPQATTQGGLGLISISKGSRPFRIDHCYFGDVNFSPAVINVASRCYGSVVDHNVRHNTKQCGLVLCYWGRNMSDQGDLDFQRPANWGSNEFVFVEDNWFQDGTDISMGGKLVIRHNHVHAISNSPTSGELVCHGTGRANPYRGGRAYEVYNNDFHYSHSNKTPFGLDSGTEVIHDNTFENAGLPMNNNIDLQVFRMCNNYNSPFYGANGFNAWDINDGRTFDQGTLTGGGSTVTDSTKNWPVNKWIGYSFKRTRDGATAGITSNTANQLKLNQIFGANFVTGDQYQIGLVKTALDQPGLGAGGAINRGSSANPNQAVEPCYSWNNINTDTGAHVNFSVWAYNSLTVRSGVHYFNDTPMPGYKPYVYPHPLVSGAPIPTPSATPSPETTATSTPATPSPTPSTPTPTETPSTPTPTATATATPIASPTPTPAATPQPTPTATPQPPTNIPSAPISLLASPGPPKSAITISWQNTEPTANATLVERSADGTHFTLIYTLPAAQLSYTDRGLTSGQMYWYRVQVRNPIGVSDYSNMTSAQAK